MIEMDMSKRPALWLRVFLRLCPLCVCGGLALAVSAPVLAEELIDPCDSYQGYVGMGSETSGMALSMKQVCDAIGPVKLTNACMTYFVRVTDKDTPPDEELKAKLAADCDDTMPGGSNRWIKGDGASDAPAQDDAASATDLPITDLPDGQPPTDTLECGAGLECRPEPDDPQPVDPDEVARVTAQDSGASVPATADAALDLAFWQAIVDSADPALFQAYLDRFPNGTFAPIAKARLAAAAGTTTPAVVPVEPPPEPEPVEALAPARQSPQELFDAAEAIMASAYQSDVASWDAAALRAIPLYEAAGAGDWAPAYVELGNLAESGIGMPASLDRAYGYFLKAGRMGVLDGYYRALMVLDQAGNDTDYVDVFLTLYRIDADMALESLDAVGRKGPLALQRHLRQQGYYTGTLDGAFGPASRTALYAFFNGAPPVAPSGNATPSTSGGALAADLQAELQRVGCYLDTIDGRWGPASANALAAFNLWNGSSLETGYPTEEAMRVLKATRGQICGMD